MPFSYVTVTGSTSDTHSYSAIELLDETIETHEEQLRVFKNGVELEAGTDYEVVPASSNIELTTALIASDQLLIMRQTRIDKMYVEFQDVGRFEAQDQNLYRDQILYLAQEINEESDIFIYLTGITPPIFIDDSNYSVTYTNTTDDTLSYASIDMLPNHRVRHKTQLEVYKNGTLLALTTDYTVDPATTIVDLAVAPITSDTIKIIRASSLVPVTTDFKNATPLASGVTDLMFQHILFVIEELPYAIGLAGHALRNRRRPRRINYLRYSGPGDRFSWAGLPWNPDSTVIVWVNDELLVEGVDYYLDPLEWVIIFPDPIGEDDIVTIIIINPTLDFPGNPLDDLTDQQDELGGDNENAPAICVPCTRDSTFNTVTEVDDEDELNVDVTQTLNIRVEWNIPELRNKNFGVTRIGFTSTEGVVPVDYEQPYILYATGEDYDIIDSETTAVTGNFILDEGWIQTEDIEDFIEAALERNNGKLYIVVALGLTADNNLEFHSTEQEYLTPDENHSVRLSIQNCEFPEQPSAGIPGFHCTLVQTVGGGAITRAIQSQFNDFSAELPYDTMFDFGAGTGDVADDWVLITFLVEAAGTYTLTGTGEVFTGTSGSGSAMTVQTAIPNGGFTEWTPGLDGTQGSDADLANMTPASGVVPFSIAITATADDIGKYWYLRWSKQGVPAFSGTVLIESILYTP